MMPPFHSLYTLLAYLMLIGEGYAQFKRNILPASPPFLATDVSFPKNNASFHFIGVNSLALLLRQEEECPVGYPIQCENLGCCPDSEPVCVSLRILICCAPLLIFISSVRAPDVARKIRFV
jgi:hypothetical protein